MHDLLFRSAGLRLMVTVAMSKKMLSASAAGSCKDSEGFRCDVSLYVRT